MRTTTATVTVTAALMVLTVLALSRCVPPTVVAREVGEDRANAVRTALAARDIIASVRQVDALRYDVVVDAAAFEDAEYVIANARIDDRPSTYGDALPASVALREKARAIEEVIRTKPGVVQVHVVLLAPAPEPSTDVDDTPAWLRITRRPWAHVGIVYESIDERGTAAFHSDKVQRVVVAETGLDWRDVRIQMLKRRPL